MHYKETTKYFYLLNLIANQSGVNSPPNTIVITTISTVCQYFVNGCEQTRSRPYCG